MAYVYIHKRNDTNKIFYVGKGNKRRAWSKTGRNNGWFKLIKKLEYEEIGYTIEIIERNLSEEQALLKEKQLIKRHNPECNLSKDTYPTWKQCSYCNKSIAMWRSWCMEDHQASSQCVNKLSSLFFDS